MLAPKPDNQWDRFNYRNMWTSLVLQWIRICLPVQATRFDTWSRRYRCHGVTKPIRQHCWALALEPRGCKPWACALESARHSHWAVCCDRWTRAPGAHAPWEEPPLWKACHNKEQPLLTATREAHAEQRRAPHTTKIKTEFVLIFLNVCTMIIHTRGLTHQCGVRIIQ